MQPKFWVFLLTFILLAFCNAGSGLAQGDYLLGPEDLLEITVWGHEDLKRQVPVSLDGTLTFPLLGEIKAAGKTTQQLEKALAGKLGEGYLKNPQITVTVKEYKSQKVYVMGEVKNPGTFPVTKENNLLFVLSQAGGFTKDAGEEVVVIRPKQAVKPGGITLEEAQAKQETTIRVNLKDALAGDRRANVTIRDGDSIVVPKMPFFFVMGEVKNPGQYNLERGTTVLMGVSLGGGLTPKSAPNRTKIVREVDGKKTEIKVGMETLVQPGDTIIVPESYF
ncbi:MAG: polysaccharide biosynthesis/export family protein [Deltaproteobacteria bacterium]|nr:polysaccharide biosynthesis/export family protein [Deltaproteobacteria bacterium]